MKKIYFSSVILLLLLFENAGAQNACPGPNPPVVRNFSYMINGQQICIVFVENMLPNSPVTLFGPGLTVIPTASGNPVSTDATGFAAYAYNCNQVAVRITACNVQGCCAAPVPAAATLPVRLTKFTGKLSGQQVTLDWTSVAELNSNKYVVEKSIDGKNFEEIGVVEAAGNSARAINYSFADKLMQPGGYFYRLNQVDIDGKSEYSKVVYINNGKGNGNVTGVFPNPFRNDI
jgi:hypothetical protein